MRPDRGSAGARVLSVRAAVREGAESVVGAARRADIKVGFACNNRCVFCAQGHKRLGCAHVPFAELVARLKLARETSDELVLTGGEPTLHPELIALVSEAKAMGYRSIQVQTNGRRLAYGPFLRALIDAGVTEVSPALHGPSAPVHESLTRAEGSFAQTVAGIRLAVRHGLPVVTNSVVVRANVRHLVSLVALLGSLGVKHAQLAFVHPVGTAWELFDQVVPRLSELAGPVRLAHATAMRLGMRLVTEAVPLCFLPGMQELAIESQIPDTTVIDWDGQPFDYSAWRPVQGKAHGPPCERCRVRDRCEGPWREYADRFGWDEFRPIA